MPRKFRGLVVVLLVLAVIATSAAAQDNVAAGGKLFLWQVRSKTAVVHLLGSVHVLKKEMYPLDRRIEEAFDNASVLVVETNIDVRNKEQAERFVVENAVYAGGDSLDRHVSAETVDLFRKRYPGLDPRRFFRFRPWALALTVASMEYASMGLDAKYGVDAWFIGRADGKKKIREFEAADYVPRLLSGLPDETQDRFLYYTLLDLETFREDTGDLLAAWRTGDAARMEALVRRTVEEHPEVAPVVELLVYRRNREMAARIEEFLKGKETHFVVVGAGHLVGKRGIVELLRAKGYAVEQL